MSLIFSTNILWFLLHFLSCAFTGNLVDWWEPETKKKYLEKAQCIIDQYGNYTVEVSKILIKREKLTIEQHYGFQVEGEVLNVNGITTQGENIADNGGIKETFR